MLQQQEVSAEAANKVLAFAECLISQQRSVECRRKGISAEKF